MWRKNKKWTTINRYSYINKKKKLSFIFLAAIDYLLSNPTESIDVKALEESAGIGIVVTSDDIQRVVCCF